MANLVTFKELKFHIKEKVRECLMKYIGHGKIINHDPIIEMARLNKRDNGAVPFPYNKFEIKIWSNDHNPPHFHVKSEGWDISFLIENGEVYKVNLIGSNSCLYTYIVKNIPIWLNMHSNTDKNLTNKKIAENTWDLINNDDEIKETSDN